MVRLRKHRVVKDEDDYYTEELTKAAEVPMSVPKEVFDAAIKAALETIKRPRGEEAAGQRCCRNCALWIIQDRHNDHRCNLNGVRQSGDYYCTQHRPIQERS